MGILERAIGAIDIQSMTKEVMSVLTISDLDMYFVVYLEPVGEMLEPTKYVFVGMAYSENAARTLAMNNSKRYPCKILRFDMAKLITLVEKLGATEEIR